MAEAGLRHDVFISYSRKDAEVAEALVKALRARGVKVWYDKMIAGGVDWREAIVENLAAAESLLILFSEQSNQSTQLKKELSLADRMNKLVLPVLVEPVEPRGHFLYELAHRNWISIHPNPVDRVNEVADQFAPAPPVVTPAPYEAVVEKPAPVPEPVAAPQPPAPERAQVEPSPSPEPAPTAASIEKTVAVERSAGSAQSRVSISKRTIPGTAANKSAADRRKVALFVALIVLGVVAVFVWVAATVLGFYDLLDQGAENPFANFAYRPMFVIGPFVGLVVMSIRSILTRKREILTVGNLAWQVGLGILFGVLPGMVEYIVNYGGYRDLATNVDMFMFEFFETEGAFAWAFAALLLGLSLLVQLAARRAFLKANFQRQVQG